MTVQDTCAALRVPDRDRLDKVAVPAPELRALPCPACGVTLHVTTLHPPGTVCRCGPCRARLTLQPDRLALVGPTLDPIDALYHLQGRRTP